MGTISFEDFHSLHSKISSFSYALTEEDSELVIKSLMSKDLIQLDPNEIGSWFILTEKGKIYEEKESQRVKKLLEEQKQASEKSDLLRKKEEDKLHYDLENARTVYETYPTTQLQARWGFYIAILAIIVEIIRLVVELSK